MTKRDIFNKRNIKYKKNNNLLYRNQFFIPDFKPRNLEHAKNNKTRRLKRTNLFNFLAGRV